MKPENTSYIAFRRKMMGMRVLFYTKIFLTHETMADINMSREHLLHKMFLTQEYIVTDSTFVDSIQGKRSKGGYTWTGRQTFEKGKEPEEFQSIGEDWKYFNITTSFYLGKENCSITRGSEIIQ